jgi:hypothetical protein
MTIICRKCWIPIFDRSKKIFEFHLAICDAESCVFLQIYRRTPCTPVTNKPRVAEILERALRRAS